METGSSERPGVETRRLQRSQRFPVSGSTLMQDNTESGSCTSNSNLFRGRDVVRCLVVIHQLSSYWAFFPLTRTQFGNVSSPREAACCFALSRRFSILVVLLFRLGREDDAWSIGEDHTCWAWDSDW